MRIDAAATSYRDNEISVLHSVPVVSFQVRERQSRFPSFAVVEYTGADVKFEKSR